MISGGAADIDLAHGTGAGRLHALDVGLYAPVLNPLEEIEGGMETGEGGERHQRERGERGEV